MSVWKELNLATSKEVDKVWNLIKEDSEWLSKNKNLNHWSDYYTKEIVFKKIQNQEVYLFNQNSIPVATITVDTNPVDYYTSEDMRCFFDPDANAIYISGLAVKPELQGRGIASKLMNFAENEAKKRDVKYLRLDCRAEYHELVKFYEKRGFIKVGGFNESEKENYFLMEKII